MRRLQQLTTMLALTLLGGATSASQHESGSLEFSHQGNNRERMHPGTALDLVGIEEGPNSFRDDTPSLERTDRRAAYVDPEQARSRHLAMYQGHSFHAPLERKLVDRGASRQARTGAEQVRREADQEEPPESSNSLAVALVAGMIGLFGVMVRLLKS